MSMKWCKINTAPCVVFLSPAINHHVACWLQGEKKGRAEAGEGGAGAVVQSQNTTDAKVAGMDEVGGREKIRGKNLLLNLITCMDGQ